MNFSEVLSALKKGNLAARRGWRLGTFLGRYWPGSMDYITETFLYIDTINITPSTPSTIKGRAPWVPSQCDMNAQDWYILNAEELDYHVDAYNNVSHLSPYHVEKGKNVRVHFN